MCLCKQVSFQVIGFQSVPKKGDVYAVCSCMYGLHSDKLVSDIWDDYYFLGFEVKHIMSFSLQEKSTSVPGVRHHRNISVLLCMSKEASTDVLSPGNKPPASILKYSQSKFHVTDLLK